MPYDPQSKPMPSQTKSAARYLVPLALMVAIIGGIAWVAQNLPSGTRTNNVAPHKASASDKPLVSFERRIAQWGHPDGIPYEFFEPGSSGSYDFLFKNTFGQDIEVTAYSSTCDCTSIRAAALPMDQWDRLNAAQGEKPGAPLAYQPEPAWTDLPRDREAPAQLVIKPDQAGVVRVLWNASKGPDQALRVSPGIWFQPAGDASGRRKFDLAVPAAMTWPVRCYPQRPNPLTLLPGSTAKAEFAIWSATRDDLNAEVVFHPPDPLFDVQCQPLSREQCADLEKVLTSEKVKILTRVRSGYHVTVTAHESVKDAQLDLGSFYRKLAMKVDGILQPEIPGPEIVGRVQGEVQIGGTDDHGKVRFKSFGMMEGASKTVDLLADAHVELTPIANHQHQPAWVKVKLTKENEVAQNKRIWHLQVTIPPRTLAARSFDEPDAVVLRIGADGRRVIRIPLEGHVSGR